MYVNTCLWYLFLPHTLCGWWSSPWDLPAVVPFHLQVCQNDDIMMEQNVMEYETVFVGPTTWRQPWTICLVTVIIQFSIKTSLAWSYLWTSGKLITFSKCHKKSLLEVKISWTSDCTVDIKSLCWACIWLPLILLTNVVDISRLVLEVTVKTNIIQYRNSVLETWWEDTMSRN